MILKRRNRKSHYVFLNPETGQPLKDVKRSFPGSVRRAGIEGLRFHDLRHTFASRLVETGVDLITVKELLGHHSVRVTERYTHSGAEQKRKAVEKLAQRKEKTLNIVPILSKQKERVISNDSFSIN